MIPLKEMKPGIWYRVVTNGSTLFKGDLVKREKVDDSLLCKEANGWLTSEEWKRLRNKVEISFEYYEKRKARLESEIARIKELLK